MSFRLLVLALLSLTLSAPVAISAEIPLSNYAANTDLSGVAVSPSGNRLVFREQHDKKALIRIVDLKQKKTIAAFDIADMFTRSLYFISEDKVIIVAGEERRLRGYRGEHDVSTAFLFSIEENKVRQLLTPGQVIYKGQSGLGKIVGMSKDQKYVFMPAFVAGSSQFTNKYPEYLLTRVPLSVEKGRPEVVAKTVRNAIDFFMDDDGNILALETYNPRDHLYQIEVPDGNGWREIYRDESQLRDFNISGVAPDREHLVLVTDDNETGFESAFLMSLKDGEISDKLFSRPDKDITAIYHNINRVVHGIRYAGFTPTYEFFDESIEERLEKIQTAFQGESVYLVDMSPDFEYLVVKVTGSAFSGDYFLIPKKGEPVYVGSARKAFGPETLNPIIQTAYPAQDGLNIPLLVTIPAHKQDKLQHLPAIMMPHGGPESYDAVGFDWIAQAFANRGYLVIQPQFRGSRGFGTEHVLAGHGEWGKKMQTDLLDAIDVLAAQKLIDKDKVCIVGWSYGGYAALAGGAFDGDAYKCVVAVNGVADINRILRDEKREENRYMDVYAYWNRNIRKNKLSEEELSAISPADHAENFKAPVLIIYGEDDEVVSADQSKIMIKALKKADKEVEVLKIKDEGHSFREPKNRLKTLEAMVKFVNKYLSG